MTVPSGSPKLVKMQRFVPGLYKPTSNVVNRGVLYSFAGEDDQIVAAAAAAKAELYVTTADSQYLNALGSNVGVFRPSGFDLQDPQFRQLIPILSFFPKQIKYTIIQVLNVFYGVNNPKVQVVELSPNEIIIQIPDSVPAFSRGLLGANHLKAYTVVVNSINNTAKTMSVTVYGNGAKVLAADELNGCSLGQGLFTANILGNTTGYSGVIFQFSAGNDLSTFTTGKNAVIMNPNYLGAYIADPTKPFSITSARGVLGQSIVANNIAPTLTMLDSSNIPDSPGSLCFNYGFDNEEGPIKYFSRPNNSTLRIDPGYKFKSNHSIEEVVNVVVTPNLGTNVNGLDYRPYLVGTAAAQATAQQIIESIVAAGIVITWIVIEPQC